MTVCAIVSPASAVPSTRRLVSKWSEGGIKLYTYQRLVRSTVQADHPDIQAAPVVLLEARSCLALLLWGRAGLAAGAVVVCPSKI